MAAGSATATLPPAAAVEAGADNLVAPPKHRMPTDHVQWILAQESLAPPPRYAALRQSNPDLTPRPGEEPDENLKRLYVVAKAFYETEERFPKVQAWVRAEMETKGYVEVDEEWVRNRAAVRAVVDRQWPKIQARLEAMVREDEEYASARRRGPRRRGRGM